MFVLFMQAATLLSFGAQLLELPTLTALLVRPKPALISRDGTPLVLGRDGTPLILGRRDVR